MAPFAPTGGALRAVPPPWAANTAEGGVPAEAADDTGIASEATYWEPGNARDADTAGAAVADVQEEDEPWSMTQAQTGASTVEDAAADADAEMPRLSPEPAESDAPLATPDEAVPEWSASTPAAPSAAVSRDELSAIADLASFDPLEPDTPLVDETDGPSSAASWEAAEDAPGAQALAAEAESFDARAGADAAMPWESETDEIGVGEDAEAAPPSFEAYEVPPSQFDDVAPHTTESAGADDVYAEAEMGAGVDDAIPSLLDQLTPVGDMSLTESVAELGAEPARPEVRHASPGYSAEGAGAFGEVADRLEEIARLLRQGPEQLLASGSRDPLDLLITGFVLGYAQRRG